MYFCNSRLEFNAKKTSSIDYLSYKRTHNTLKIGNGFRLENDKKLTKHVGNEQKETRRKKHEKQEEEYLENKQEQIEQ